MKIVINNDFKTQEKFRKQAFGSSWSCKLSWQWF